MEIIAGEFSPFIYFVDVQFSGHVVFTDLPIPHVSAAEKLDATFAPQQAYGRH